MLNRVLLIGNLTKDPQGRFLPSGSQVVDFSIAYNRRYRMGDEWKEETHYFDVRAYGRLAERLLSGVSKGYTVVVEGRLAQDRWTDNEGKNRSKVYVIADSVKIIRKPRLEGAVEEEVLTEDIESLQPEEDKPFRPEDEIPF